MELLRKVANFSTSIDDKRIIYILYVRSILEQSSVVWHSSLTKENIEDLERVQKSAVRIILGKEYEKFKSYEDALTKANLEPLECRREELCEKFAAKCLKNDKTKSMFPIKDKTHNMLTRGEEYFDVKFAHTGRLKDSAIPYMQRILNNDEKFKEIPSRKIKLENEDGRRQKKRTWMRSSLNVFT